MELPKNDVHHFGGGNARVSGIVGVKGVSPEILDKMMGNISGAYDKGMKAHSTAMAFAHKPNGLSL